MRVKLHLGTHFHPPFHLRKERAMKKKTLAGLLGLAFLCMITWVPTGLIAETKDASTLVYVGTYTGGESRGIYLFQLDPASGTLTARGLAAEISNPSFLAVHPDRQHLYAVGELNSFQGKKGGAVTAFSIDTATGKLTQLNQQSSGGSGPCHITVDKAGRHVLVANYGGGSVSVLPLEADGKLGESVSFIQHQGKGEDPLRQEAPHAHSINLDAANRFAFVADLGLDKIMIYRFDAATGKLTPNQPAWTDLKAGSGPRHFSFQPSGRFAYVINEMQSTVTAFSCDAAKGILKEIQTISTLPEGFSGSNSTAEVQVHPSGKFLYGSNRGHDSIAVFSIDGPSGKLKLVEHQSTRGKEPRNFGIDPSGKFLLAANQNSGNLAVFKIDANTGGLSFLREVKVPNPVCVKFLLAGGK